MDRLNEQVAVVTGASRGFGRAMARALAAEGAQIVALARTVQGLEALDDEIRQAGGKPVTIVPIDLREHDRIASLGPLLLERHGRCDMLIANAALIGQLSPIHQIDPVIWDRVIDVNLNANQRLLATLEPLLRTAPAGQAVFVTSRHGHEPVSFWGAYAVAKAGLEMLARLYASEASPGRPQVTLVEPGVMRTALRAEAFPGEDASRLPDPDALAARLVEHLIEPGNATPGELIRLQLPGS